MGVAQVEVAQVEGVSKKVSKPSVLTKKLGGIGFISNLLERLRAAREELFMDNDLLFMLTYMASLSTAQLSRDKIFQMAAEKEEYTPSKYFRKVRDLTQKWHYDYANACELIAQKIKHERVKKLFNRFSNAISAGEPDREFLEKEWQVFKTIRKDEYDRSLESLRKWTDAYTSILVSASLISVVMLLSVIIYRSGDPASTLYSSAVANFFISLFGVGMLFKAIPKDQKTHSFHIKSREQVLISRLTPIFLPAALAVLIFFTLIPTALNMDMDYNGFNMGGIGFLLAGILLLPVGILGKIDDTKISKRDEAFTTFIRSLGAIKSGAGVSVAEALSRIDQKNLGELKDLVAQLYRRLAMGLDPRLCWEKFIGESGSYLIHKLTSIFVDASDLGGDSDVVGEIVSSSNLEMVLLRLKRDLISSGFVNLIIPLHLAMVGLLLFITQILAMFTQYISLLFTQFSDVGDKSQIFQKLPQGLQGLNLGIFGGVPIELLNQYAVAIILSTTIANTVAAKIVKGGGNYLYLYYGGILSILSGVLMIVVPKLVEWMFSLPSFVEVSLWLGFT